MTIAGCQFVPTLQFRSLSHRKLCAPTEGGYEVSCFSGLHNGVQTRGQEWLSLPLVWQRDIMERTAMVELRRAIRAKSQQLRLVSRAAGRPHPATIVPDRSECDAS